MWAVTYLDAGGRTHEGEIEADDIRDAIDVCESQYGDDIDILCLEYIEDDEDEDNEA